MIWSHVNYCRTSKIEKLQSCKKFLDSERQYVRVDYENARYTKEHFLSSIWFSLVLPSHFLRSWSCCSAQHPSGLCSAGHPRSLPDAGSWHSAPWPRCTCRGKQPQETIETPSSTWHTIRHVELALQRKKQALTDTKGTSHSPSHLIGNAELHPLGTRPCCSISLLPKPLLNRTEQLWF